MTLRAVSLFLALGGLLAVPALAAGPNQAIMVPVTGAVAAVNADDAAKLNAYFMPTAMVVDEIAPFTWSGPHAAAAWLHDLDRLDAQAGITSLHATLGDVTHFDVTGDHAYVVAPLNISWLSKGKLQRESGLWVFTLYHEGPTWKIATVSWATQRSPM
jgi:ketosteroid isomerase-like protein